MSKDTSQVTRDQCVFSCNEPLCLTLDKAGVPSEDKWRTLILYMRSLEHYDFLTDQQKISIQRLLVGLLKEQDYSDENYSRILAEKEAILSAPCNRKLEAAIKETAALVKDFKGLVLKRKGNVEKLETVTVDAIQQGKDPEELVTELRSAFKELVSSMEEDAESLSRLSRTDSLTSLNNRRAFDEFVDQAVEAWQEDHGPLCLLMIDIDHFKKFNDNFGHRIGDQALATVAKIMKECGQERYQTGADRYFPARYGGEEFSVVLPGAAPAEALEVAEDIRERVGRYNFIIRDTDGGVLKRGIQITVSIGVSDMSSDWNGAYGENLIDSADKALYAAKQGGRNMSLVFSHATGKATPDPD
ncbi:MAG: GGDEF domain-containing protein [Desulfovibrio sp.]|nr:MAG: GGDEF domain-containing protein [Desulfovibrio sp.]